jgi:hypothetical protein
MPLEKPPDVIAVEVEEEMSPLLQQPQQPQQPISVSSPSSS